MRRYAASTLAAVAAFAALVGLDGISHMTLLAAVVAAGLCVLDAVTERVARRVTAGTVVLSVAALVAVVGGAALHAPLLALGACLGLVRLPPLRAPEPVLSK